MRAPATPLPPITAKKLREIIAGLGPRYEKMMPVAEVLTRRAAVFTAHQPQHDRSSEDLVGSIAHITGSFESMHLAYDEEKERYTIEGILRPPGSAPVGWPAHAFGHPRYEKPTTWHNLLETLCGEFHGMMGRVFGKPVTARFLCKLIPLVTGEAPLVGTIERELYRQAKDSPPKRERIHPR
jgi:hypothetical protein